VAGQWLRGMQGRAVSGSRQPTPLPGYIRGGVDAIKAKGLCGEVSPDGNRVCILDAGHAEPHPWESRQPTEEEVRTLRRRAEGKAFPWDTETCLAIADSWLAQRDVVEALKEGLRDYWTTYHDEHCTDNWPHAGYCHYPSPAVLREVAAVVSGTPEAKP
jgi:hypothetical protein